MPQAPECMPTISRRHFTQHSLTGSPSCHVRSSGRIAATTRHDASSEGKQGALARRSINQRSEERIQPSRKGIRRESKLPCTVHIEFNRIILLADCACTLSIAIIGVS